MIETTVSPHSFQRLGWRWWACKRCYMPRKAHPVHVWAHARPLAGRRSATGHNQADVHATYPTTLVVPDSPKMLRETLCVAQARIAHSGLDKDRSVEHVARLGRLIDECDRHRPIGPDGQHSDRHTSTCGCKR